MDRLQELLRKLNEEFAENARPEELLLTLKQMEAYLLVRQAQGSGHVGTSRTTSFFHNDLLVKENPLPAYHGSHHMLSSANAPVISSPIVEHRPEIIDSSKMADPATPTAKIPELHEVLPADTNDSMNDRLKAATLELGDLLNDAPIRDLKKAIGINDRFVFIAELFRGDELLYERSIRTINAFRIYQEANFWMERELKLKLGWDAKHPLVQQFDQLVRRRFS